MARVLARWGYRVVYVPRRSHTVAARAEEERRRREREIIDITKRVDFPELGNISLRLITPETDLFYAKERDLPAHWNGTLPWWAFCWPGGYGMASFVDAYRGQRSRRVVDFACGCGIGAVAALRNNFDRVLAVDICPYAATATEINVGENGFDVERLETLTRDIIGSEVGDVIRRNDIVLAGDVLYDDAFAKALLPWLQYLSREGVEVFVSDPGRWVLGEMCPETRDRILAKVYSVEFADWFSKINHGLTSSSVYKVMEPVAPSQ